MWTMHVRLGLITSSHMTQTVVCLNCDTPKLTQYKVLSNSERSKSIARANEIPV